MIRLRNVKILQKFASVHALAHNHFSQERHFVSREIYKERRSAALAEWRSVIGVSLVEFGLTAPSRRQGAVGLTRPSMALTVMNPSQLRFLIGAAG